MPIMPTMEKRTEYSNKFIEKLDSAKNTKDFIDAYNILELAHENSYISINQYKKLSQNWTISFHIYQILVSYAPKK